jgi:hypothetical protein
LLVSTPLKNISQLALLFPIYGKNVPNHQPVIYCLSYCLSNWQVIDIRRFLLSIGQLSVYNPNVYDFPSALDFMIHYNPQEAIISWNMSQFPFIKRGDCSENHRRKYGGCSTMRLSD